MLVHCHLNSLPIVLRRELLGNLNTELDVDGESTKIGHLDFTIFLRNFISKYMIFFLIFVATIQ